jgi:hypothetical protein
MKFKDLVAKWKFRNLRKNQITQYYEKNHSCLLAQLCDKYGSDKGEITTTGHPYPWKSHTYTDFYSQLFDHCRDNVKYVFECGLGTNNTNVKSNMTDTGKPGASLRVWRDYFPKCKVVGVDIDRGCLFTEERIKTEYMDQTDPQSIKQVFKKYKQKFDFIIDDGLHEYFAGKTLFENCIDRLSDNGIYIIEDVKQHDVLNYEKYFRDTEYRVSFINLYRQNDVLFDNSLIMIRKKIIE